MADISVIQPGFFVNETYFVLDQIIPKRVYSNLETKIVLRTHALQGQKRGTEPAAY